MGSLARLFLFSANCSAAPSCDASHARLSHHAHVRWAERQARLRPRARRQFSEPTDPQYWAQWYLHNTSRGDPELTLRQYAAWAAGYTGRCAAAVPPTVRRLAAAWW